MQFLWVTLAPCREGKECWDEGCLHERRTFFLLSWSKFFLLGVTEGSGLILSREEGWSQCYPKLSLSCCYYPSLGHRRP